MVCVVGRLFLDAARLRRRRRRSIDIGVHGVYGAFDVVVGGGIAWAGREMTRSVPVHQHVDANNQQKYGIRRRRVSLKRRRNRPSSRLKSSGYAASHAMVGMHSGAAACWRDEA